MQGVWGLGPPIQRLCGDRSGQGRGCPRIVTSICRRLAFSTWLVVLFCYRGIRILGIPGFRGVLLSGVERRFFPSASVGESIKTESVISPSAPRHLICTQKPWALHLFDLHQSRRETVTRELHSAFVCLFRMYTSCEAVNAKRRGTTISTAWPLVPTRCAKADHSCGFTAQASRQAINKGLT